jgi:hypothetical protein
MSVNLEDARRVIAAAEKKAFDITTKDLAGHSQSGGQFFGTNGYRDFDKGESKKFVLNSHGLRI